MDRTTKMQGSWNELLSSLVVGFYAWISAIFFGMVLLDVRYARSLSDLAGISEGSAVFSEVSDYLLVFGSLALLAALGAVALSWKSRWAKYFFVGSLIILLVEFIAPALLSDVVLANGYLIRVTANALASLLAFMGAYEFYRLR